MPVAVVCPSLGTAHTYVAYLLGYGVHIQSDGAYTAEQALARKLCKLYTSPFHTCAPASTCAAPAQGHISALKTIYLFEYLYPSTFLS